MQIQNNKLTESRFGQILSLAVPISVQSMVQTSFSMIDQLMICKLGSPQIAAVGIAGKFLLIYNIAIGAVSVIAGIMIAQYLGANDKDSADRSMNLNLLVTIAAGAVFFVLSLLVPSNIIRLYTKFLNLVQQAIQVVGGFGVNANEVCAGLCEFAHIVFGVGDHQVAIQRKACALLDAGGNARAKADVWHKVTVHDVQVNKTCATVFDSLEAVA